MIYLLYVHFAVRPAVFDVPVHVRSCRKSQITRITIYSTLNHPVCTKKLHPRSSIYPIRSTTTPFSKYLIFYDSPLTGMLIIENRKKCTNIKFLKIHNSFNNFGRGLIYRSMLTNEKTSNQ